MTARLTGPKVPPAGKTTHNGYGAIRRTFRIAFGDRIETASRSAAATVMTLNAVVRSNPTLHVAVVIHGSQ